MHNFDWMVISGTTLLPPLFRYHVSLISLESSAWYTHARAQTHTHIVAALSGGVLAPLGGQWRALETRAAIDFVIMRVVWAIESPW